MPNWVINKLTIEGDDACEILQSLLSPDPDEPNRKNFDFNKIIPMPLELNIESGSLTDYAIELYLTYVNPAADYYGTDKMNEAEFTALCDGLNSTKYFTSYNPCLTEKEIQDKIATFGSKELSGEQALARGKQAANNYIKFGAKDWYDWRYIHWGTKWNACHTAIPDKNSTTVFFDTAWAAVVELIRKLSEIFPDNTFKYKFAEEDTGSQTGDMEFKNGELVIGGRYENWSKEAYETYFELWGGEELYKYNLDTNTYDYIGDKD